MCFSKHLASNTLMVFRPSGPHFRPEQKRLQLCQDQQGPSQLQRAVTSSTYAAAERQNTRPMSQIQQNFSTKGVRPKVNFTAVVCFNHLLIFISYWPVIIIKIILPSPKMSFLSFNSLYFIWGSSTLIAGHTASRPLHFPHYVCVIFESSWWICSFIIMQSLTICCRREKYGKRTVGVHYVTGFAVWTKWMLLILIAISLGDF